MLALLLLASAAAAQPTPPAPALGDGPAPAPTAKLVAEAYVNSIRFERERALRRAQAALAAAGADDDAFLERLRAGPGPDAPDPAEDVRFLVDLYGCAPAAGEPGHVCLYGYRLEDDRAGASATGPALVRGHVFPGPNGPLVRELPLPGPLGPREGPGGTASGG